MTAAPERLWLSDPPAYRERLYRLLGDRDPLEVLARTPSALGDIVRQHPVTVLRTPPAAGHWTPNEIIGHLVDSEWVYGFRLRLILSEDNPPIRGTDQESWVARQRHNDREASELVEAFRALRQINLALWQRLSPVELNRTGQHNERGPESLREMLRMMAGHDLSHLDQIWRFAHAVLQLA